MSEEKQKSEEVYTAENAEQEADTIFGSTLPAADTVKSSGGLSKNAQWLLLGGIALILLGGGLTAVLLTSDKENVSTEDSTEPVCQGGYRHVQLLSWRLLKRCFPRLL